MKRATLAGVLSIIAPGAGQLYNGQIKKWLLYSIINMVLSFVFPASYYLAWMFTIVLAGVGFVTIILLPLMIIPFLLFLLGFVVYPRHKAYEDAIIIAEKLEEGSSIKSILHNYFTEKQRVTIIIFMILIETIVSLFILEYSWKITKSFL
jgi:hypothetical protein